MRRSILFTAAAAAVLLGAVPAVGASTATTVGASTATTVGRTGVAKKTDPTTLPIGTVPTTTAATDVPAGTGKILMLKIYVDDLAAAETFYGSTFGTKLALTVGDRAHIITFPDGGPGLVLLQRGAKDKKRLGGFIVQVPNLEEAKARALANGATEQGTFAGNPGSQAAKSVDVLDPWGNQVEILQLG